MLHSGLDEISLLLVLWIIFRNIMYKPYLPSATKLRRFYVFTPVCLSTWGVCSGGGSAPGGSAPWGVSGPGEGGCLAWGVSGLGGVGIPACTEADPPADGYCWGWYASHWDAFLWHIKLFLAVCVYCFRAQIQNEVSEWYALKKLY